MTSRIVVLAAVVGLAAGLAAGAEGPPTRNYFAHPAAVDKYGVIAPWYQGLNGQCDFRVRIAAETLKRYPWAEPPQAVMAGPHFVFNGHWSIKPDGTILPAAKLGDWDNGDVGQRSASLLVGLTNYYRYTGDPAAIGLISTTADFLVDYCQTPDDHPWPGFLISCPTRGKAYGRADPRGFIQLDVSAQVGSGMVMAYQLTGNPRYLEAVKRWADLLAKHCDQTPGARPWNRYANPEDAKWDTRQTGGVSLILKFLDDVIRLGHQGKDGELVKARDAGERYLRDVILPEWSRDPTWGHHFWDWLNPVTTCAVPCYTAQYLMDRPEAVPEWKSDVRNFVSLSFCRLGVDPASAGGLYSGAWALPEASNCCGKSLQYPSMAIAATLARYGVMAESDWAQEIARRQALITTYDALETGVVADGIDGQPVVAGAWFNLAHPWPLRATLEMLAWQPEHLGAARENHIVRSDSVVRRVEYGRGSIRYATHDAASPCRDVLRLAFRPQKALAGGEPLPASSDSSANGYVVKQLANGDCLVTIRHDGRPDVVVEGDDPQQAAEDPQLDYAGAWSTEESGEASGNGLHAASAAGASASFSFEGNQVRVLGRAAPDGGRADVYLDGIKQLCGIDFWCPEPRNRQVVCYKNGLAPGKHTVKIVASGTKNPLSAGTRVYVDAIQWSAASGQSGFGEGGGPAEPQRVIFGYLGRKDYVDSSGNSWRPATELVLRAGKLTDPIPKSFRTEPSASEIAGTPDPELYRYGVRGGDFTAYFTVDPKQTYSVRIKLCQTENPPSAGAWATTIDVNGKRAATDLDVAAAAGGLAKALDLVENDVSPASGVIAIRFHHPSGGTAAVQAIEVVPKPNKAFR